MKKIAVGLIIVSMVLNCFAVNQGSVLTSGQKQQINSYFTDTSINYTKPYVYMTIKTGLRKIIANKTNVLNAVVACPNMPTLQKNTINLYFSTAEKLILYVPSSSTKLTESQKAEVSAYFIDANGLDYSTGTLKLDTALSKLQEIYQAVFTYNRLCNGSTASSPYLAIATESNKVEYFRQMFVDFKLAKMFPPPPPDPTILSDPNLKTKYPSIYGIRQCWFRTDIDFYEEANKPRIVDYKDLALACDPNNFVLKGIISGNSLNISLENMYWHIKQLEQILYKNSTKPENYIIIKDSYNFPWTYNSLNTLKKCWIDYYNKYSSIVYE